MTRTVEDAAVALGVLAGYDARDPHTIRRRVPDYMTSLKSGVRGLRVGLPREFFEEAMAPEIEKAVKDAVLVLEGLGAKMQDVSFHREGDMFSIARVIHMSEASAFHDPWIRTRPDDYGRDVRLRVEQGRLFLATDYVRAQQARMVISRDFANLMKGVDVIVVPASPIAAPPIAGGQVMLGGRRVDAHAAAASFLRSFNLIGAPAISVPCGFTEDGLPIGFQIAGRLHDDATVLRVAYAYEQATPWKDRHPPV
jgi:aspartyl-tRNA(Asn)/glutamyl-tRNA(Gln) amidotransferase subunit A